MTTPVEGSNTFDLHTWMEDLHTKGGARWFKLERTFPVTCDNIASSGFIDDLTEPVDESMIRKQWGGGAFRISALAPKGRGKAVLEAKDFELSGPPRAYPGADKQPVLFPSAKVREEEGGGDESIDAEFEDDGFDLDDLTQGNRGRGRPQNDFPPLRGHGQSRDFRGRDRFEEQDLNPRYRRAPFREFAEEPMPAPPPPYANPAERMRESLSQRTAVQASTDSMRILNEANSSAQRMLADQLENRNKEMQQMREALAVQSERTDRPIQEAINAFKMRMEEQRADFTAQLTGMRTNYEQQIGALRSTFDQQLANARSTSDQQLAAMRTGNEQQVLLLSQRHDAELRSLASRQESEVKNLQREIDRTREDATTRLRDAQEQANRRAQEVRDLLAAQYETRIAVLTSERDVAQRRADEIRQNSSIETQTRISDERRSAEGQQVLMKTMLEGREQVTVSTITAERDRLRDELNRAREELTEARKAADPMTSLKNVAMMSETMKSLGLAGPVGEKTSEEPAVPDDLMGKMAAYAPKIMGAMEPILRRGDAARAATVSLQETQIRAQMQARHLSALQQQQQQGRQAPPQVALHALPQSPTPPVEAPQGEDTAVASGAGAAELLSALDTAFKGGMSPDQVASFVQSNLAGASSPETKELLEDLLSRPGDEVANELSTAAEALGYSDLSTPRATVWLQGVHRALNAEDA